MVTRSELVERLNQVFPQVVTDLTDLVAIPSVSAAACDQSTLQRSATFVAEMLERVGLTAQIASAGGRPAVLAQRVVEGAPSVLLYAHHDVQPVGDAADWDQEDPFTVVERNGRLYGRGTADDKAGVVAHAAAVSLLPDLPATVRCFIEGEEEVGSPTFAAFLKQHSAHLEADTIVVLDSVNWKVGTPALTSTLRGLAEAEVTVRVADHALHSGGYGGPILDAPTLMARLVATLHDHDGRVAVAGLQASDVTEVEYPEADFRADSGVVPGYRLTGPIAQQLWMAPAISLIGMDVPSVAQRSNTIQPSCRAYLSLRVPPSMSATDAYAALERHLLSHAPLGAEVTVAPGEQGPAFTAKDSAAKKVAREALDAAWQTSSVEVGTGGSIPFLADFESQFPSAEILVMGIEDPDSRAHSPNESMDICELRNAILAEAILLAKLAGVYDPSED